MFVSPSSCLVRHVLKNNLTIHNAHRFNSPHDKKTHTNLTRTQRFNRLSKLTSTQTLRETKDAQIRHGTSIKNIGHDQISKDAMAWTTNSVLKKQIHAQQNCWGETSKRIGVIELKSSADKHCLWMFKVQTPGLSAVAVDAFRCGINGNFLIDVQWCWCSLLVWWCLHTQITLDLVCPKGKQNVCTVYKS